MNDKNKQAINKMNDKNKQAINKMIPCDLDTHTMVKQQAAAANMSMGEYVKLCAISCKTDKKAK